MFPCARLKCDFGDDDYANEYLLHNDSSGIVIVTILLHLGKASSYSHFNFALHLGKVSSYPYVQFTLHLGKASS